MQCISQLEQGKRSHSHHRNQSYIFPFQAFYLSILSKYWIVKMHNWMQDLYKLFSLPKEVDRHLGSTNKFWHLVLLIPLVQKILFNRFQHWRSFIWRFSAYFLQSVQAVWKSCPWLLLVVSRSLWSTRKFWGTCHSFVVLNWEETRIQRCTFIPPQFLFLKHLPTFLIDWDKCI